MLTHSIEPGQRLQMQAGGKSSFVHVLAEAVVPADYWICRDEISGQNRVIARTALFPIAAPPAPVGAADATAPSITTAA